MNTVALYSTRAQLKVWHETFFLILTQSTCDRRSEKGLIQFIKKESNANKALVISVRRFGLKEFAAYQTHSDGGMT